MIEIPKQIHIFIWYISINETIFNISDRFNVTESAFWRTLRRIATAVHEKKNKNILVGLRENEHERPKMHF